jgi:hypothetical protein
VSPLKKKDLMNEFEKGSGICGGTNTKENQDCETDEEEGGEGGAGLRGAAVLEGMI